MQCCGFGDFLKDLIAGECRALVRGRSWIGFKMVLIQKAAFNISEILGDYQPNKQGCCTKVMIIEPIGGAENLPLWLSG